MSQGFLFSCPSYPASQTCLYQDRRQERQVDSRRLLLYSSAQHIDGLRAPIFPKVFSYSYPLIYPCLSAVQCLSGPWSVFVLITQPVAFVIGGIEQSDKLSSGGLEDPGGRLGSPVGVVHRVVSFSYQIVMHGAHGKKSWLLTFSRWTVVYKEGDSRSALSAPALPYHLSGGR